MLLTPHGHMQFSCLIPVSNVACPLLQRSRDFHQISRFVLGRLPKGNGEGKAKANSYRQESVTVGKNLRWGNRVQHTAKSNVAQIEEAGEGVERKIAPGALGIMITTQTGWSDMKTAARNKGALRGGKG